MINRCSSSFHDSHVEYVKRGTKDSMSFVNKKDMIMASKHAFELTYLNTISAEDQSIFSPNRCNEREKRGRTNKQR